MSARSQGDDVAVVIPARNEADRIRQTVTAAAGLPGVGLVVVVDDGSRDGTGTVARRAARRGAAARPQPGQGGRDDQRRELRWAWSTSGSAVSVPGTCCSSTADLAESAAQAVPLTDPVLADRADMTIAVFAATVKLGGHGLVVGLSGTGIRRAVGWQPTSR